MEERGHALVLIGFMGTGKSAVGRRIARDLRLPRFDTDELVATRFGMPVAEIFSRLGEPAFRDAESELLEELNGGAAAVIVTGGGIVLRAANVTRLRQLGTVIRMTADEPSILERVSRRSSRPLLQKGDAPATVRRLLAEREPLYRGAADAEVDTSSLSHEEAARAVIAAWNAAVHAETP